MFITKIAFSIMKAYKDYRRLMIMITFFPYVRSATVGFIGTELHTDNHLSNSISQTLGDKHQNYR